MSGTPTTLTWQVVVAGVAQPQLTVAETGMLPAAAPATTTETVRDWPAGMDPRFQVAPLPPAAPLLSAEIRRAPPRLATSVVSLQALSPLLVTVNLKVAFWPMRIAWPGHLR
jgi:hypothetical protein